MATVFDVAQYILQARGPMTTMKLQKLVFYSQAWSIAWDDDALYPEKIYAWRNGPVVRELWESHRGKFRVSQIDGGDPRRLSEAQRVTIDKVLEFYGDKSAQWLSDLTHMEDPWRQAWESGHDSEITLEKIAEYYSTIEPVSATAQKGS